MLILWLRRLALALSLAAGMAFLTAAPAMSASYEPQQQLPASTLAQFTTAPGDILKLSNGELISKIRYVVVSSPANLQLVPGHFGSATAHQASAIAAGLGQTALICVRTDQAFATEIQNTIVTIGNSGLTLAFAAIVGDPPIGGVVGGGGWWWRLQHRHTWRNQLDNGRIFRLAATFPNFATKNTRLHYIMSSSMTGPPTIATTVISVNPTI